jgi:hypothetical protein
MRLLLCDEEDEPALWAGARLASLGVALERVTSADLMRARRWDHGLEGAQVRARVELADGRLIDTAEVHGTLNRLVGPRADLLAAAPKAERDYALHELWALWMSWLRTLPEPVLNAARPNGLCGPWHSEPRWLVLAARSGLRTQPWSGDGRPSSPAGDGPMLLVAGGAVVGPPAPADVVSGCQALSLAVGCPLLGIWFAPGWMFMGASVQPDLRRGGQALIEVLARVLGGPP